MPQPQTLRTQTVRTQLLRTFIALPLDAAMLKQLTDLQLRLRRACPPESVRWVNTNGIHLTLFFLGDTLLERIKPVQQALTEVAQRHPPVTFEVQHLGAFPNPRKPRVIWVGLHEPTGALAELHLAVNAALEGLGFTPEDREFKPHLTLGRIRQQATAAEAQQVGAVVAEMAVGQLGAVTATELVFFQSTLKPTGAEYTPLAKIRLG